MMTRIDWKLILFFGITTIPFWLGVLKLFELVISVPGW
jgi:hypothetical protein